MVADTNVGVSVTGVAERAFVTSLCSNAVKPVNVETEAKAAPPPITIALFVAREDPVRAGNTRPTL